MLNMPINLNQWIESNRDLLKPPVGNKCIEQGDFIIMIVGGPNSRSDFHLEEGPEFFYQIEGQMVLRVQEGGAVRDIPIGAGEIFYLPPGIPHSPQRMANSVGLVIERKRLPHEQDALQWYCPACNHLLFEQRFALKNIELDLPPIFQRYYGSESCRTCSQCGHVDQPPQAGNKA